MPQDGAEAPCGAAGKEPSSLQGNLLCFWGLPCSKIDPTETQQPSVLRGHHQPWCLPAVPLTDNLRLNRGIASPICSPPEQIKSCL